MPNDIAAFRLQLNRAFSEKVDGRVLSATKMLGLRAHSGVIFKTPVDEGTARGNWQMGIGRRPNGVLDVVDKSGTATIQAGKSAVDRLKPYDTVYIANNLPYIGKLESGSSQQAPAGMVAVTVAELQAFFGRIDARQQL